MNAKTAIVTGAAALAGAAALLAASPGVAAAAGSGSSTSFSIEAVALPAAHAEVVVPDIRGCCSVMAGCIN